MSSERVAYKGKLLKVYVMKKRLPHGYVATYEIIKHPGAALIVPFLSREKVLLIRLLRPVVKKYIYEFPAGTLDKGEKPLRCAYREIIEETGYMAGKMTLLGDIFPVPGYSTERIFIFRADKLKKVEHIKEPDEVIENHIVTRAEVKRLFKSGKIVDAKTIAALAMIGWL